MKNFSGLTITGATPDGYSVKANGYVKGSWLQSSVMQNYGSNTGKVCVFDGAGWIYYRTPTEILTEAGGAKASEIPTNYVTTDTAQDITGNKTVSAPQTIFDTNLIIRHDAYNNKNITIASVDQSADILQIENNQVYYDPQGNGFALNFQGSDPGTDGQVLTSRGADNSPEWANVTKHGYTQLTNEDLNTITEAGWYNAAQGNTCTNRPSKISTSPFILEVEKCTSAEMRQTLYTRYWTNGFYIRTSTNSGSSWTSWQSQYTVDTGAQVFSGRKSFSGGINLTSSLQVGGSSGTAGQVLTSTGTGAPQWTTPTSGGGDSVASVVDLTDSLIGGNSYFVFNNGEEGSFTGIIYCEYNTSAGDFDFEINDQIFSCTPASQGITLRVTIDRMYNGYVYYYYYTIVADDKSINESGFFTDTHSDMYISTNMDSSYIQHGVGVIIKKVV